MDIIDALVTDRTQKDVANGTEKGYYNSEDLNRVNAAASYLAKELENAGYFVPAFPPQKQWDFPSIPSESDMSEYLGIIKSLKYIINIPEEDDNVCVVGIGTTNNGYSAGNGGVQSGPDTMSWLNFILANDIERILVTVNRSLDRLAKSVVPCGIADSGGDYF